MIFSYMKIIVIALYILLTFCSCSNEKTDELTTQNRIYIPSVSESNEDNESREETYQNMHNSITRNSVAADYLSEISEKIGVNRDDYIERYGVISLLSKSSDGITEGLLKIYPDVDFNEMQLPLDDSSVSAAFILSSKLYSDNNMTCFKNFASEADINMQINTIQFFNDYKHINEKFKYSEDANDARDFYENSDIDIEGYLVINMTLKNDYECSSFFVINDKNIYNDLGTVGKYNIVQQAGEFLDLEYHGNNRGTDKERFKLIVDAHESIEINCIYSVFEGVSLEKLYFNPNPLISFGYQNNDGVFIPNNDKELGLYKIQYEE